MNVRVSRAIHTSSSRPLASCVLLLLAIGLAPAPARAAVAADSPTRDSVRVGGAEILGVVLDVTDELVVIQTPDGKQFLARDKVSRIRRDIDEDKLATFDKYFARYSKSGKPDWKKLAKFARREALYPEFRRALRKVLEDEPDNRGAHKGLGEAEFEGVWLAEREVELKKAAGYAVEDGRLVRAGTKTKVKSKKIPKHVKILPRKELTDDERKKIEADRRLAEAVGEKFRQKVRKERKAGKWNQFRTKHFIVECNSTKELTQRYGVIMELIRGKLSKMFRSPVIRNLRAPVKIYANQESFMEDDMYGRWGGRGLGGYYMPSNQQIVTYHGTFGFTGTTFGVLAHEGTHYYQGLVLKGGFDNVPMWLIEGLAVYFGDGARFDPEARSKSRKIEVGLIPRDRLSHLQEKMQAKRHTKIEKLVKLTRRGGFSGSHYADAWGLIYFLVNSGDAGTKLMQQYWGIGLKHKLTLDHFTKLAEKYYGTLDKMNEEWVEYILALKPPPAGKIVGDYFICEDFQFELEAPDSTWQFFEDDKDKKLLIGLLKPDSSVQIRVYFENNMYGLDPEEYMEKWKEGSSYGYDNLEYEEHKIAGLPGYKATYVDTRRRSALWRVVNGRVIIDGDDDDDDDDDDGEKEEKKPLRAVRYLLVQKDGIASIECSAEKADFGAVAELFDDAHKNFRLIVSRRW